MRKIEYVLTAWNPYLQRWMKWEYDDEILALKMRTVLEDEGYERITLIEHDKDFVNDLTHKLLDGRHWRAVSTFQGWFGLFLACIAFFALVGWFLGHVRGWW